ncbi:MAG: L,D-transpeptidase family protein [Bacteroidota bacterium]
MKYKILIVAITLAFYACDSSNSEKGKNKSSGNTEESNKKVTKRNYYINKQNSYSEFFFDSSELVKYITSNSLNDSLSRRMISFYNNRNYQYAWFTGTGPTEQARGFWNMYEYYLSSEPNKVVADKAMMETMDRFIASDDTSWTGKEKDLLSTELKMTDHFIRFYLSNIDKGYIKRKEMEKFVPYVKSDAIQLADSLLQKKHKDDKYYEDVNKTYGALKDYLGKYMAVQKGGGWPIVNATAKQLNVKTASPLVSLLKKRLYLSGDLAISDTTTMWNDTLASAIKNFQVRHGYTPTGQLTEQQLKDMNVPVDIRIQQLLINMGRTQWVIDQPKGKFIVVNIPEFIFHLTERGQKVFDMPVVVGKEGHNTMMFTGNLNQIVFSPYWNVPYSIVQKEILPAVDKDPNYLAKNNMEINGTLGNGIPAVRQLPGEKNSLGKVKFLFPNSFDIYFHDTPAKSLFEKDKRAYSHGCIRLSEPTKLAEYLLKDSPEWTPEKINAAMNAGEEKYVKLKEPVPVLISYYTAWVDENGFLHFAEDIYGHDKLQAGKIFTNAF